MTRADFLDRTPALARLKGVSRVFSRRHAVVMAVQDNTLILTWMDAGERQWRRVEIPNDLCRDGLPMQRESLGEICAELLFDNGLPPELVDVELLLPLEACHWRLLAGEGFSSSSTLADLRGEKPLLDLPFQLDDAYLAAVPAPDGEDAQLLVGVQRLMLQAWVDVVEAADLSLRRVDWLMASAWRGLVGSFDVGIPQDLVWLLRQRGGWRVLLLNNGLPELDRLILDSELDPVMSQSEGLRQQLERTLSTWDVQTASKAGEVNWQRYWWISACVADQAQWLDWMAREVHGPILGVPQGDLQLEDVNAVEALIALALKGDAAMDLLQERRPELGLPAATPVVQDSRKLLLKGASLGGGLMLLGLLGIGAMAWLEGYQAQQLEALLPVEQEVLETEAKLGRLKQRITTLAEDNKKIANQLVAVRASSALLEQMRQVASQNMQFRSLEERTNVINLSGNVLAGGNPGGLERINSLLLTLSSLSGTKRDGVTLQKAKRDDDVVSFDLKWNLDPSVKPTVEQLESLGATGMAVRLRMLEQQGVQF